MCKKPLMNVPKEEGASVGFHDFLRREFAAPPTHELGTGGLAREGFLAPMDIGIGEKRARYGVGRDSFQDFVREVDPIIVRTQQICFQDVHEGFSDGRLVVGAGRAERLEQIRWLGRVEYQVLRLGGANRRPCEGVFQAGGHDAPDCSWFRYQERKGPGGKRDEAEALLWRRLAHGRENV